MRVKRLRQGSAVLEEHVQTLETESVTEAGMDKRDRIESRVFNVCLEQKGNVLGNLVQVTEK